LFSALRQLGYGIDAEAVNEKLPARITGDGPAPGTGSGQDLSTARFAGPWPRSCSVSIENSSQFASALLLCAKAGGWQVAVQGQNAEESPYVAMTAELIKAFPEKGGVFQIEPDASSGSYFLAAERLLPAGEHADHSGQPEPLILTGQWDTVSVLHWPTSGLQIDAQFEECLLKRGLHSALRLEKEGKRSKEMADFQPQEVFRRGSELTRRLLKESRISRNHDLGDSIMMAIVLAPFALWPMFFTDLGRLRVQECERVMALRTELARCGAKVIEEDDTLTVFPSELHGAEIETYNDHRMAMCFAVLGLKVPGIKIKNPSCVKKTFPNFFQKLALAPPRGLGAVIRDGRTGQPLDQADLFAG
jgi:3-phosphoshikimate 1-carboxyvinyltransferase